MIRAAAALLAASFLVACGTGGPVKCQPSNCSGCCAANGECLGNPAQTKQACGTAGNECRACLPDQLCASGRCTRDPDAGVVFDDAGSGGGGGTGGGAGGGAGGGSGGGSPPCGEAGQACCAGNLCTLPATCTRGLCEAPVADAGACGAIGQPCCANQQCTATGATCSAGSCIATPDAGQPRRATGEPCTADSQCLDGACLQVGFTGGYCTKACTVATDCFAGSQCGSNPSLQGPSRLCLKQCSSPGMAPGGCRTGYVCEANAGTSGVPVCFPACASSVTCGAAPTCDSRGFCCGAPGFACCEGTTCEGGAACMNGSCQATAACGNQGQPCCATGTACVGQTVCRSNVCASCGGEGQPCCANDVCTSGTCQSGTCQAPTGNPLGGSCTAFTDCTTNACIQAGNGLWSGGYCSQTCAEADPASCPTGSSCSRYVASPNFYCLEHCAWDGGAGGCRTGYVCDRGLIAGSTQATCFTRCNSTADCGGLQCQGGFCCGATGFRCCTSGTACTSGTCNALGYCQ